MTAGTLILVVDDNDTARYGKSRILRGAGYQVLEAATGTEALQIIAERMPRLVVLDVQLPDIGGWEICRRIKTEESTASMVVLQVSATHVTEADTVRALEGGADASLIEPVEAPVLIATVKALLRARQAEDAIRDALAREQAARAEAEAANRAKDEFLAVLSHELRSPIGAVLTWVTLLRSGQVDGQRAAHALAAIERNTRLQVKLIEDLLDVSRIISGKLHVDMTPVELATVVDSAIEAARPIADAKSIRLAASAEGDIGFVAGDPERLQQIVSNLLSNAIKFTPAGGGVQLALSRSDGTAKIRVSDTGRGIDPDFLPHLFERFRQADSSSTRRHGGLGLGLAIVRHLVELHGGTVSATSPGPGHGSTFTVTLPLSATQPDRGPSIERHVAGATTAELAPTALRGVRVVIVDDEPDARDAIAAVLEQCGATVTPAASVRDGLALVDRIRPDVVVSDIAMPGEDGYTFIQHIRQGPEAALARVPTLALTAFGGHEEERRIRSAGYDRYLAKPVDAAELVHAVTMLARGCSAPFAS
jgi:signal transduction histidine kinase